MTRSSSASHLSVTQRISNELPHIGIVQPLPARPTPNHCGSHPAERCHAPRPIATDISRCIGTLPAGYHKYAAAVREVIGTVFQAARCLSLK
jgi:hypothetical protein